MISASRECIIRELLLSRVTVYIWTLILLLVFGIGLYFGVTSTVLTLRGRNLETLNIIALEESDTPLSSYVDVEGEALLFRLIFEHSRWNKTPTAIYYPLISTNTLSQLMQGDKSSRPIKVIVKKTDFDTDLLFRVQNARQQDILKLIEHQKISGIARRGISSMPSDLIEPLKKAQIGQMIADDVLLIEEGKKPLKLSYAIGILAASSTGMILTPIIALRRLKLQRKP